MGKRVVPRAAHQRHPTQQQDDEENEVPLPKWWGQHPKTEDSMATEDFGRELLRLVSKRVCRGDDHWLRLDGAILDIVTRARESGWEPIELINTPNRNSKTALMHIAQLTDNAGLVEVLLQLKADATRTTNRGHTALHYAASKGHDQVCAMLLEAGARVRVKTVNGDSPVSLASVRLSPAVHAQLLSLEQSDEAPWIDFRDNPAVSRK